MTEIGSIQLLVLCPSGLNPTSMAVTSAPIYDAKRLAAEAAADAAVEVHDGEWPASEWRRRGYKKLDVVSISTDTLSEDVQIRACVAPLGGSDRSGSFAAALRGATLVSTDFGALKRRLRRHLAERTALVFERWIRIDYDRMIARRRGDGFDHSSSGYADDDGQPIVGVRLEFEVCEISGVVTRQRHAKHQGDYRIWRRLERAGDAWTIATREQAIYDENLPDGCVPYTEARYQSLLVIQAGIRQVATLLDEVVGEAAIESGEAALRPFSSAEEPPPPDL